jgi:hypothetical protein
MRCFLDAAWSIHQPKGPSATEIPNGIIYYIPMACIISGEVVSFYGDAHRILSPEKAPPRENQEPFEYYVLLGL